MSSMQLMIWSFEKTALTVSFVHTNPVQQHNNHTCSISNNDRIIAAAATVVEVRSGHNNDAVISGYTLKKLHTCQVSRISRESHAFSLNSRISARLNIISRILFDLSRLSYALVLSKNTSDKRKMIKNAYITLCVLNWLSRKLIKLLPPDIF